MTKTKVKRRTKLRQKKLKLSPEIPRMGFQKPLFLIIFAVTVAVVAFLTFGLDGKPELSVKRGKKKERAIRRTVARKHAKENCEQYVLIVRYSDYYPVLHWGVVVAKDSIWLSKGEVWKYGITCNGELQRYPNRVYYKDGKFLLTQFELQYAVQFKGAEKKCKIEEKRKIYNYPLLPECVMRARKLMRPPGHKNDN